MDLLKAELERKRKALALTKKAVTGNVNAGELRRVQELVEQEGVEPNRKKSRTDTRSSDDDIPRSSPTESSSITEQNGKATESSSPSALTPSNSRMKTNDLKELIDELRSFGLPIRLFAEDLSMQKKRLIEARQSAKVHQQDQNERSEFKLEAGHGIRNTFLDKGKSLEASTSPKVKVGTKRNADTPAETDVKKDEVTDDNIKDDPHKWVYRHLKDILKEWEQDIDSTEDDPSQPASDRRNQIKTYKQCKDYIRPLFKQLQRRSVEPQMLKNLLKIVQYSEANEFVQAHSAYMDVAIGRAAWPIGVTAVGIHARTGRSKIESNNVAHVMNSELQRKYLTSVKRLLSYRQSKAVDVDPSKKVLM